MLRSEARGQHYHSRRVAGLLGFQPLPIWVLLVIAAIVAFYIATAEMGKKLFYKIVKY